MRTTLDLPEELIKETMKVTGAKTKTEAITKAMQGIIEQKNRMDLLKLKGTIPRIKEVDLDVLRDRNSSKDLDQWTK